MKRVLIIEDERNTRENLRTILEMEGYQPVAMEALARRGADKAS